MERTEFIQAIREIAEQYGTAAIQEIAKANNRYLGMYVERNGVPTAVVNLDMLYAFYCDTGNIDECLLYADETFNKQIPTPININRLADWDFAKKLLYLRLLGHVSNGVCRPVADMYQVPYIQLTEDGAASVQVDYQLLDAWGVTLDEVFDQAEKNQETIRPAFFSNLAAILRLPEEIPLYVLTTGNRSYGAGVILYDGVADKVKSVIGEDFYLIPSSIHEMLVLPKSTADDLQYLASLVAMVNNEDVADDEVLSDSVYTYDFADHTIVKVS